MKTLPPDTNTRGEVINGERTNDCIAVALRKAGSIIVGWNDPNALDHYDILFTIAASQESRLEEGLHAAHSLFVSIMSMGAYGFNLDGVRKQPELVADTLSLDPVTARAVADLINGVAQEYLYLQEAEEPTTSQ